MKHHSDELNHHKKRIEHWQVVFVALAVYDAFVFAFSFFAALWLRFDCQFSAIPSHYLRAYLYFIPIYVVFSFAVFYYFKLYQSIWRFASYTELLRTVVATLVTFVFHCVGITLLFGMMPMSYYIFGIIIQFVLTLGIRFSYRFVLLERSRRTRNVLQSKKNRVMIVGAGESGQLILRDIRKSSELNDDVCCFIDDNPNKWGRYIDGVPVKGGRDDIFECVERYAIDKIYIAIPSASLEEKRDILNICKETGCVLKNLPGVYQLLKGDVKVSHLRDVNIEDLLGRDPIRVNLDEIDSFLNGKTVLITGGGGSIGSELSRSVVVHHPKKLIIFDIYENNAYDIQQELKKKYPDLDLEVIIGSVRDSRKIFEVFETYKPDVVYHAAAHKHVPLMEDSPCEAIKNNVIGTYKTAYAAMVNGVQRFVLISTDKAVNPTNIMGASKRLCEMVIQVFDKKIKEGKANEIPPLFTHWLDEAELSKVDTYLKNVKTEFVAVRFGNVLGSNGSVIPLFKKQIAQGGPVTVTHPDIIRYFMTIPEAVSLVLQAGTYAKGGEIFVLDMGSPVKIDTLARNLIKLSGLKPDVDIKIEYTGLRPGEKLFEEKLMSEEGLKKTPNELIHIGSPIPFDNDVFLSQLAPLMSAAYANDKNIREIVQSMVSTYHPEGFDQDERVMKVYDHLMKEMKTSMDCDVE